MANNPFSAKAKITITPVKEKASSNPFAAKVKTNGKPNPFAARAKNGRADKLTELDRMIAEAETRYEESLTKALKGGVNRAQIKKLFDISDRRMNTLMSLCGQRRRIASGADPIATKKESSGRWSKSRRQSVTPKQASASTSKSKSPEPTPSKQKKSSQTVAAPKKKGTTRTEGGRARRTRRRR